MLDGKWLGIQYVGIGVVYGAGVTYYVFGINTYELGTVTEDGKNVG